MLCALLLVLLFWLLLFGSRLSSSGEYEAIEDVFGECMGEGVEGEGFGKGLSF